MFANNSEIAGDHGWTTVPSVIQMIPFVVYSYDSCFGPSTNMTHEFAMIFIFGLCLQFL